MPRWERVKFRAGDPQQLSEIVDRLKALGCWISPKFTIEALGLQKGSPTYRITHDDIGNPELDDWIDPPSR